MSEFFTPSIQVGKTKLRFKLAALVAALSIAYCFSRFRSKSKEFLTSEPAEQRADRTYSRIWFDNRNALVGAIENPEK